MIKVDCKDGSFCAMKHLVTQALWKDVVSTNPSKFIGDELPVDSVSWIDCVLFANSLSRLKGFQEVYDFPSSEYLGIHQDISIGMMYSNEELAIYLAKSIKVNHSANGYRLPGETEWRQAAMGGENHDFSGGNELDTIAWYKQNSEGATRAVGTKSPNALGFCDMSGNVYEWGFEWEDESQIKCFGGSYDSPEFSCEVWSKDWFVPSSREKYIGFRLFKNC